jgi:phosphopentomutase
VTVQRVIWIVMDSVGVGELPDAGTYGDQGSNTVGNIARLRRLNVPTLRSLGLASLVDLSPDTPGGLTPAPARGAYGRMVETSAGKDSVTGHWEMAGLPVEKPFATFPHGFPAELIADFERRIGRKSIGNVVASGTAIIAELGPEHVRTGFPIVYTSADSVFQIAAHEDVVPIDELYRMCHIAYELAGLGLHVARVIARPFIGDAGAFQRTPNRRDFALEPFGPTVLDHLVEAGVAVIGVGKIEDLFAGRGLTEAIHTLSDSHGMDVIERQLERKQRGLIFANLVDFDAQYGHRNDVEGYASNLERFDDRLGGLLSRLAPEDVLIVTADHGNDPTTPSTDHSREHVPVFVVGGPVRADVDVGTRATFADLGQTVAEAFGARPLGHGTSFWREIVR